jgi:hypothetical protein
MLRLNLLHNLGGDDDGVRVLLHLRVASDQRPQ